MVSTWTKVSVNQMKKCIDAKKTTDSATGTIVKEIVHHIIHYDIIGPIQLRTIRGARRILCSIVEAGRYAKVLIIKKRCEVNR